MTSVLVKDGRHKEGQVEAETGGVLQQAEDHLEPSKAGRGEEGFAPRTVRESMALLTP